MSFVRQSKFRHVFGTANKPAECYSGIKVSKSSFDTQFCAVNPKFVAIITHSSGGGSFLVLPLEQYGRLPQKQVFVNGHTSPVTDLAWCPFNDNILASCGEDAKIKIWQIPEGGPGKTPEGEELQPIATLQQHQRKVTMLHWHPTAEYVLLSAGADNTIRIWDFPNEQQLYCLDMHPDQINSVSWSVDGSKIATTCKDKNIRIIDVRKQEVVHEIKRAFEGSKPAKVVMLKDGKIFALGFSKMAERLYVLYDPESSCEEPLTEEELDSSAGNVYPFYDPDNNIMFTAGKGDSTIKYYEINDEEPYVHWLSTYSSNVSQRGLGYMPKRGCDVTNCEIARFYKLHKESQHSEKCEPISMTVPRKSDLFQEDIFPDFCSDEPALTAAEWVEGKNALPKRSSWREVFDAKKSGKTNGTAKAPIKKGPIKITKAAAANSTGGAALPEGFALEDLKAMKETIDKLQKKVKRQHRRIKKIEKVIGEVVAEDDESEGDEE